MLHETNGAERTRGGTSNARAREREREEMGERGASVFKRGDVTSIIKEAWLDLREPDSLRN